MSKWEKFDSSYSPVKAGSITVGSTNIVKDWNRLVARGSAFINGKPLSELAQPYMIKEEGGAPVFENVEAVKSFFSSVLLQGLKPSKRDSAISFLETSLHQGGLMYPVSAPFASFADEIVKGLQPAALGKQVSKKVNFVTTDNGFKVQEIYQANEFRAPMSADLPDSGFPQALKDVMTEDYEILPDIGNSFVVKAHATVDIDFSTSSSAPDIMVESNTISYGNSAIAKTLDTRSFGQIIKDFFKNMFGANKVKDLSENIDINNDINNEQEQHQNSPSRR